MSTIQSSMTSNMTLHAFDPNTIEVASIYYSLYINKICVNTSEVLLTRGTKLSKGRAQSTVY